MRIESTCDVLRNLQRGVVVGITGLVGGHDAGPAARPVTVPPDTEQIEVVVGTLKTTGLVDAPPVALTVPVPFTGTVGAHQSDGLIAFAYGEAQCVLRCRVVVGVGCLIGRNSTRTCR